MRRIVVIAVAFAFALTQVSSLNAQLQGVGSISGTIAGPRGALGGVTVQAVDAKGTIVGNAVTSDAGTFRIAPLRPGTYTVHVLSANGQAIATSSAKLTLEALHVLLKIDASAGTLAKPASTVPATTARRGGMSAKVVLASVGAAAASLGTLLVISTQEDVSGSR